MTLGPSSHRLLSLRQTTLAKDVCSCRMRVRRSRLSVPARPSRKLEKASELVADEVVVDLEDSVPAEQKEEARAAVAHAAAASGPEAGQTE